MELQGNLVSEKFLLASINSRLIQLIIDKQSWERRNVFDIV